MAITPQLAGMNIVRNILKTRSFPNGFTTGELFKLAVETPPPEPFIPHSLSHVQPTSGLPILTRKSILTRGKLANTYIDNYPPNPDHAIRSIRFLKKEILPHLAHLNEIKITRVPKQKTLELLEANNGKRMRLTGSQVDWVWMVVPESQRPNPPAPPKEKTIVGREVGVGADTSHLNNRRRQARVGKVSRAVIDLKAYGTHLDAKKAFLDKLHEDPELAIRLAKHYSKKPGPKPGLRRLVEKAKEFRKHQQPTPNLRESWPRDVENKYNVSITNINRWLSFNNQRKSESPEILST